MAGAAGTGGEDGGTAQQLCAEIAALQHAQYVALGCAQDNSVQIQAQCGAICASLPQCIPAGEALGNCVKQQPASNRECSSSGNPQLKSPYCSAEEDAAQACAMGAMDGGDGDGGDAACWAAGSAQQCHQCCAQTHSGGQAAMFVAMGPCLCQASVCQTACAATTCASPPKNPDATCQACLTPSLSTGGACETDFATACAADPLCAVTFACNQGCLSSRAPSLPGYCPAPPQLAMSPRRDALVIISLLHVARLTESIGPRSR